MPGVYAASNPPTTGEKGEQMENLKASRIYIQLHNLPTLRLQPHKDDDGYIVAKCKNPEAIDMVLRATLLAAGHSEDTVSGKIMTLVNERFQGHKYAIAVISRGTAADIAEWASEGLTAPPPTPEVAQEPLAGYDGDDEDDLDV